ncbi:MAG: methylmalonyl-CoA mutase family protein [Bacteroidota bacterium]
MSLFSEFPTITKEEWLTKIEKDLKGKAVEELNWNINGDWMVSPLAYSSDWTEKGTAISLKNKANNSWEIGEVISVKDIKIANQEALVALEGGVNALLFDLPEKFTSIDFELLLKGIQLEWISTHFRVDSHLPLSAFLNYLENINANLQKIRGSWRSDKTKLDEESNLTQFKMLSIDATTHYKDTAHTIEELVQTLLAINAKLKEIEVPQSSQLQVSIAIGESYFINIAKIRALKILWHNLMTAYQLETPLHLEAHLAQLSLTNDQHQNMIQMSTQALSAVIGGIDRLFLTPADHSNTAFTKRIARNVQHLLQLESHLDHVIDPSSGSYYIENLTNEMVKRAWEKFTALADSQQ